MRVIVACIAVGVLRACAAPASAQAEIHTFHCWQGCPTGTPAANDLIVREIYSLSSNDETRFADWVAFRITRETIGPSQSRNWRADPWLSDDETLEPPDYRGAFAALNTNRGHQAPLAAFSGTAFWSDTNYLSNIVPQLAPFNQGPWQQLEAAELDLVRAEGGALYVLTGPLYERTMPRLPGADEPHRLPSGFWRVIVTDQGEIAAFAFVQETPRSANPCAHQVPLDEVEQRSGLRLFPRLSTRTFRPLADRLGCP